MGKVKFLMMLSTIFGGIAVLALLYFINCLAVLLIYELKSDNILPTVFAITGGLFLSVVSLWGAFFFFNRYAKKLLQD
jgi:hypothetical protein